MTYSVIFDMDGTLFQTNTILEPALEETFNHFRSLNLWDQETPIETYRKIMGVPLPVVWERLMPDHSEAIREQANVHFLQQLIAIISVGKGELYPRVKETLQHLVDHNYKIYIASNGLVDYLQAIVNYYELDKWVTETFSIQQISSQNKSDLVQHIKTKYGITYGAVVGDRLSDINAAKDNQLTSIGCRFDFAQEAELAQADVVINNFDELRTVLHELHNRSSLV
ncbi:HAD hydrolase-like protein [Paenibacillus sp. N1-5-1-14]|uniref:HAD family hydrolase n=1 Tax=Paenibacillus radicibacter TaxID=2972488 RepID=UPI0021593AF4|nr:HAD family hydrolase [Paenibacillus radicibacter]MCR8644250.1 HAD hydrolase-like protein [Paenibacillus radicibacter]